MRQELARATGVQVWRGESAFDGGGDVVAVVTLSSDNAKTGDVPTLWVLPTASTPADAIRTGADVSACGSCPLAGTRVPVTATRRGGQTLGRAGRACYVRPDTGVRVVWEAWNAGRYPVADLRDLRAVLRRSGAPAWRVTGWGDVGALPLDVLGDLLRVSDAVGVRTLGYTHAATRPGVAEAFARHGMGSGTLAERASIRAAGFRGFLVAPVGTTSVPGAVRCPADPAGPRAARGDVITCRECLACSGRGDRGGRGGADVWIAAHGAGAVHVD
jgi:hypothetical protein